MPFMAEFDHNVQELLPAATEHASNLQQTIDRAKRSLQAAQDRQQAYTIKIALKHHIIRTNGCY